MLRLAGGDWTACLLPAQGGAFARLAWRGTDVLVPLPEGADPNAGGAGAFVMAPWANRLDAGRVGGFGRVPVNRRAEGTAIHGLLRERPWTLLAAAPDRVELAQAGAAESLPWRWRARLAIRLGTAVEIALGIENAGDAPMVFGSGWHPFFLHPPGTRLRFAARRRCTTDARMLPTALLPTTGLAGAVPAGLDTAFEGWDGQAEIQRPDLILRLAAHGAWARGLQVFHPPGRGFLCVEPVSHLPDAVNRPWLGAMDVLAPGERLAGGLAIAAA